MKSDEQKISLVGFLILTALTLAAGISVYAVMLRQSESLLSKSLQFSLKSGMALVGNTIASGINNAQMMSSRPFIVDNLSRLNADPGDRKSRDSLNRIARSFVSPKRFSGVSYFDAEGKELAKAGSFLQGAERLPLNRDAFLLWKKQFVLHVRTNVFDEGGKRIGSIATEAGLLPLNTAIADMVSVGRSSEFALCGALNLPNAMDCYLNRISGDKFQRLDRVMEDKALPMNYALEGKTGVIFAKDYRRQDVAAAYTLLKGTDLGMVLKIDLSELYGPIQAQLKSVALLLAILVLVGELLLYWMVMPLVRKLVDSRRKIIESNEALRRANEKNMMLLRNASDGIHILDSEGNLVECSDSFCEMLGYTREEMLGKNVSQWDVLHPEAEHRDRLMGRFSAKERTQFETRHRRKNGEVFDVEVSAYPLELEGKPVFFNSSRDITERKHAEEYLRMVSSVFHHADEGIVITDTDAKILEVNPAFTRITGYEREEVLGRNPSLLHSGRHDRAFYEDMWKKIIEEGHWAGEIWNRRKNGEIYPERLILSAVKNDEGETVRYVALFSDISDIKSHQQQLESMAHHDVLTGLPNRILLNDRLDMAIAQAQRSGDKLAVCFMDLDGFKLVNDNLGHEAGDLLLIEVARRLLSVLRATDTVARLGGDEFVLVFSNFSDEAECLLLVSRIKDEIGQPYHIHGNEVRISASIGVAIYPDTDADGSGLLRYADQAMYKAKQGGRNRVQFFNPE